MKKIKLAVLSLTALLMAFGFSACSDFPFLLQGSSSDAGESVTVDSGSDSGSDSANEQPSYETITIAEALELCGEAGNITSERYYIRAIVESVTNPQSGAMVIKDETGSIPVYGTYSADGAIGYAEMTEKPYKGDEVLLHCILQNYNGTKEVKNARLIEFVSNQGKVDESAYSEMTIEDARNAEEGALVKVEGVVAQITYANGMKPNGVMLVDDTQSIYVFDGDLAGRVQEGNKVTILATKTYWILEKEQSAAEKHGYKGCNQLTDVTLVENDEGEHDFVADYISEWVEETTVKEIVENPVTDDITSIVYQVNALVKKQEGTGFVNYYFFDIDGETGSYTYTQCNGSDFVWIDEFDGKICTVYLTALNAKNTDSECFYRFLPISIADEGYQFDKANAAQFAVKYYGVDQFAESYTADPALEMKTSVSSTLLGVENIKLNYTSNDTSVVDFAVEDEQLVMHCVGYGETTVTVTGTYEGNTYSESVKIVYKEAVSYETLTVAQVIAAAVDSEVTVKGIVGPSVVNKTGFYLFGEDGSTIAVLVSDSSHLVGLEIGHEIILKGMRERYVKDDSTTTAGQTCIVDAEVLVNNYGNHQYSTAKFVDITPSEFYELDKTVDYSTTVYVMTGTVVYVSSYYSKTIKISDGSKEINLYCSDASTQYAWLVALDGQEVTVEVAACNWNEKNYWSGCVLAIRNADGTKTYNTLVFDAN